MEQILETKIQERRTLLAAIKAELVDRLQLEASADDIDDDTFLFGGGLQLDSIDSMEIVIGMQTAFGAVLPDGEVSPLRTINTLADFVEEHGRN